MLTKGADQADDAIRDQTCGLGQIVPDVLPDALSIAQAIMPAGGFRPRIKWSS